MLSMKSQMSDREQADFRLKNLQGTHLWRLAVRTPLLECPELKRGICERTHPGDAIFPSSLRFQSRGSHHQAQLVTIKPLF